MEADEAGRITRHYIYLDWQPIARIDIAPDGKPERYALHTDALGAVLAVTDEAAQLVWAARLEPFGTAQVLYARNRNGQAFEQDLRLPGQRFDPVTNLSDNFYRTYDQASGRYLEPDPLGAWANGPGPNPYAYVGGNPLRYTDPFGLRPLTDSEKEYLAPYIPQRDLDNADIHVGEMPFYAPSWADGITRGNDIYFRDPSLTFDTPENLGLLGHELVHVGQYADGMTWLSYLLAGRNGYMENPYEQEAYAMGRKITEELRKKYGDSCTKK